MRKEDDALLRGRGRYVADVAPRGTLHAAVLRSPHAHARFRIDADAARAMPGVHLVLTAAEIADLGTLPCVAAPEGVASMRRPIRSLRARKCATSATPSPSWSPTRSSAPRCRRGDRDRLAGAAPRGLRRRGAKARRAAGLAAHPGNVAFDVTLGDRAATARAFAAAARTVSLTVVNQRLVTNYLDTRGVVAEYDAADRPPDADLGSQGSHALRDVLAGVLQVRAQKLRVVTPDVGGGFGTKLFPYREYALAAVAAKRLARPVKWVADRTEHFLGDTQGRDNVTTARLALDDSHRFLALEVDSSPTWAHICRPLRPTFPMSAPDAAGRLRYSGLLHPHPRRFTNTCRSMPIAAPGGRRRPI